MDVPKDILQKISLNLSPRDILSLCLTNSFYQRNICNSKDFWRNKILTDYPNRVKLENNAYFKQDPKILYMILSEESKIIIIRKEEYRELYKISNEIYTEDNFGEDPETDEKMANAVTISINNNPSFEFLKRGDVILLDWLGRYRNDGKFMWDGNKAVILDYDIDEYGSVSSEFSFPEFRPDYFINSIDHNNLFRLSPEKMEELVTNFNVETQQSYITDKYNVYTVYIDDESESERSGFGHRIRSIEVTQEDLKNVKNHGLNYLSFDHYNKKIYFDK
uniref:F-box-like family protein n=1 Tax=Pithovirus LCPAC302 TaxID=2506593 RepID=A0A481Z804_9VIRU|nr:MAG: F-box-like family protein [Pithovirus LCPAC302]